MTVISISGAQGTGKSTVLNSLKDLGFKIIEQKTSRSILKEWGMTLHDVNKDHAITKAFQDEILRRHYDNIKEYIETDEVYFHERSFADIFGYGLNILGPFNEYNEYMSQYYIDCAKAQQAYKHVIYLSDRPSNSMLDDGVRSTGKHFCTMMDMVIKTFLEEFDNKIMYIDTVDNNERVALILGLVYWMVDNDAAKRIYDILVSELNCKWYGWEDILNDVR